MAVNSSRNIVRQISRRKYFEQKLIDVEKKFEEKLALESLKLKKAYVSNFSRPYV